MRRMVRLRHIVLCSDSVGTLLTEGAVEQRMTESMKFGPEWLRNLTASDEASRTPRFQLAEHRYGREEMLALFNQMMKAPERLTGLHGLYVDKCQLPLALVPMTEEETRMWNRGINSDAVLRLMNKSVLGANPSSRGGGRGGSVDRGRGRGATRGGGAFHYSRGLSYEEPGENSSFPRSIRSFDRLQGMSNERGWSERNGTDPGDWNGSTSPRKEFSGRGGFLNDGWRKKLTDDSDTWRPSNKWSDQNKYQSSWRVEDKSNKESERTVRWEKGRSWDDHHHPPRRPWEEDNPLPEWATENPSESGGSFDASGAFHGGGHSDDDEDSAVTGRYSRQRLSSESNNPKRAPPMRKVQLSRSIDDDSHFPLKAEEDRLDPPKSSASKLINVSSPSELPNPVRKVNSASNIGAPKRNSNSSSPVHKPDTRQEQSKPDSKVNVNTSGARLTVSEVEMRQRPSVDRQKSEDDMDHMKEVAVDLVTKLIDNEESHEKPAGTSSISSIPDPEKWYYRDPQGEVQGPFLSNEMEEWFRLGYFSLTLMVRRECDEVYSPLGELINLWRRIPFVAGPSFPPIKQGDKVGNPPPQAKPVVPPMLEQEVLLQQYQYQIIQRQLMMRQAAAMQAVVGKLSPERWATLSPAEQQQLIMQHMLQQPPLDSNVNPFVSPLTTTQPQKNPVLQLLSQLQMNKAPPTSTAATNPAPALDPLQQLIQQMGGLQSNQQSLIHNSQSVPVTTAESSKPEALDPIQSLLGQLGAKAPIKPQVESVWGTPAFGMSGWLQQQMAAPPGQLTFWDLQHPKDMKTEQQVLEEQRRAEEERRREEQRMKEEEDKLKKLEEEQRRRQEEEAKRREEEEKRKQLELELQKKEEEKRRLEENMQRLQEEKRREEQRRREEEEKARLAEEALRKKQEEAKRLEEEAKKKEKEEALKKREEEKKRKEAEKEKKRKQEEARKKEEEEQKKRLEEEAARKRAEAEEDSKRQEQARRQAEALRKLQEQQRAKVAPWSQTPTAMSQGSSLADIQRQEKEKKERELQLLLQQQQQQQQLQQLQKQEQQQAVAEAPKSTSNIQLKWAEQKPSNAKVKSLSEIQQEEQEQLAKQWERERQERAQQQKEVVIPPSASIWGTASQSLNWSASNVWGTSNTGGNGNGSGNGNVGGIWEDKNSTKSNKMNQQQPTQVLKTSNNKGRSKKDEALVMKLFEKNVSKSDEFTQWCSRALGNMQSHVDIPTFTIFLKDVESAYDVKEYIRTYLGDSKESQDFARQFLERRSRWRNAQRQAPPHDDMCTPAPAVNPLTSEFQEVKGKGKKAKKSKMLKLDNRILGFNVTAAPDRINVGDRDYGDGI